MTCHGPIILFYFWVAIVLKSIATLRVAVDTSYKKILTIFRYELKADVILLVSNVNTWLVEWDFLKPNWQLEIHSVTVRIKSIKHFFLNLV